MPKGKKKKGKGGGKSGGDRMVLKQLVTSHPGAAKADVNDVPEDYTSAPQNFNLVQHPPKNMRKQIHWIEGTSRTQFSTSAIGAVVENNLVLTFSAIPDSASYVAVFDQYCMYAAVMRLMLQTPVMVSTTVPGRLHTALDFDNVNNIGSENAIQQFSTCNTTELVGGKAVERVIKPTLAPAIWAGGAFSGYGVSRMWLNSSAPGIPHYGFRVLHAGGNVALTIDVIITYIVGLRNNI